MLHLSVKDIREKYVSSGYFEHWLDDKYIESDFAKRVVKEIDNSELVNANLTISPVLGGIPTSKISGGAKALICIMYTDIIFGLSQMGENCYSVLADICKEKDVTMIADIALLPFSWGDFGKIHFLDDDSYVTSDKDYLRVYHKLGGM